MRDEWCLYRGGPRTVFMDAYYHVMKAYQLMLFLHNEGKWTYQFCAPGITTKPEDPFLQRNTVYDYGADDGLKVIDRLGREDPELVLVSYNLRTDSITVLYHPDYNTDRKFYDRKLELLIGN